MKIINKLYPFGGIVIVLLTCFFAIKPLFIPGFFPMHDDTQVARVHQMAESIKDGLFPVRWVPDLGYGYGYPIFNFYAPFAYYLGAVFVLLGFNAVTSTKIMIGLGFVFSGVSMYFLVKEIFDMKAAIVSAVLYMYAPYHSIQLYVRGAIGEFWAYGFYPMIFLSIYKIFCITYFVNKESIDKKANKNNLIFWIGVGSLSVSGLVLSHNLSAVMLLLFLAFVMFVMLIGYIRKNKIIKSRFIFYPLFMGLLISAFYWLPAILEMNYTNVNSQIGGKADYNLHFIEPLQLWESEWGFGGSAEGLNDGMSFRIGKIHILLSVLATISMPFIKKKFMKLKVAIVISALFLLISIFLMVNLSGFVWDIIPVMQYFQFPWRFLSFVALFTSFMSGAFIWIFFILINKLNKISQSILLAIVVIFIVGFYLDLFIPRTIFGKTHEEYTNEFAVKWTASKISDEYMPKNFIKPAYFTEIVKDKVNVLSGDVNALRIIKDTTGELIFQTSFYTGQDVLIRIAPFPSWKFFINGKSTSYEATSKGIIIKMPEGKNLARLLFISTPFQKIGNTLSLFGIVLFFIGIIRYSFINNRSTT